MRRRARAAGGAVIAVRRRDGDAYCIALLGEVDLAAEQALVSELRRAEESRARSIVVDLSGLDFLDSAGLDAIAQAHRRCGDRLALLRGPDRVHRVFEITGLDQELPFVSGDAIGRASDG